MNYTYTETYDEIDNITIVRIEKVDEKGNGWIFNNDPANRHYQEYLRYTAWVEAGNTPEDFWTQDDELIEPSEPKEEEETTEGES